MIILRKIFKNKKVVLLIFFLLVLLVHQFMNFSNDDVNYFSSVLDKMSIFEFIGHRYNSWSSRVLIEALLSVLSRNVFLWRVLDSLVIVLLVFSINKLFSKSLNVNSYLLVMLLFLLYPFINMREAGFCATTLNYLWPLSFMLFGFIPFRDMVYQEKSNKLLYPFYILGLVYACNQEQCVCIVFVVSLAFLAYAMKKNMKIWYPLLAFCLSFLGLTFILTCPGNEARKVAETLNWYPNYVKANFFDKVYLAIASSISLLLANGIVLWVFSYVLAKISLKVGKRMDKIIALGINFVLTIMLFLNAYSRLFHKKYLLFSYFTDSGNPLQFNFQSLLFLVLGLGIFLSFIYLIYHLFDKERYFYILVLLLGLGTRVMMGFTPTIFASGSRTMIFLYFALIILIFCWLNKYKDLFLKKSYLILLIFMIGNFGILMKFLL